MRRLEAKQPRNIRTNTRAWILHLLLVAKSEKSLTNHSDQNASARRLVSIRSNQLWIAHVFVTQSDPPRFDSPRDQLRGIAKRIGPSFNGYTESRSGPVGEIVAETPPGRA
jgi:hypothetical protein